MSSVISKIKTYPKRTFAIVLMIVAIIVGLSIGLSLKNSEKTTPEPSSSSQAMIALGPQQALSLQTINQDSALIMEPEGSIRYESLTRLVAPPKTIVMWFNSYIPSGWVECNGQNGTPDLRNRFPLGWSISNTSRTPGSVGGAETVTLNLNQIPVHTHSIDTYNYRAEDIADDPDWLQATKPCTDRNYWKTNSTTSAGGGQAHENMPPFRVVRFIMKL
jgi:microcystin-dependent protein